MTTIHGFNLQKEQYIKELNSQVRFFRHAKTGAELLSLSNSDENKVFGITFRTPPFDSTGVAHILEHSVLCGSRKYPVKEPFVELLKSSLQTFLNAFTYPDKTCYPVASQNLQDFYNLIDVYLDAVLYPRLTPFIFQQEGWHFELENPEAPLTYKGVVFNEMKGAYSSPDNVLAEQSLQSLFPDNAYGFDSGGDPKQIPELTFEEFEAFHKRYYHPSNARIYLYGDDDPDERLKILDNYLKHFEAIDVDSGIRLQPVFDRPKNIVRPFMVGEEESSKRKGMVTVNWLFLETIDVKANFSLAILEYILLGMPASPLRKALIDSGLGEDLAGEGLGNELRQIYFSTGLKGVEMKNADEIELLIMKTLSDLVGDGIDTRTVEAALNTVEFRLRENNTGSFPRGLSLMLRSLTTWLYDADPLSLLSFEAPLEAIKTELKSDTLFFEELIDRLLLKNTHRTTLVLKPDPELRKTEEAGERDRLARVRSAMNRKDIDSVIESNRELKRLQETQDSPEALASIPVLKLSDLDKRNKEIPLSLYKQEGAKILFHDLFTNGIAYLDVGFDLHNLPQKYIPFVPLFGRALVEMGTEDEDFVTLTLRISRKTGGIRPVCFTSSVKNDRQGAARLFLRGKAMMSQAGDLIDILRDVLLAVRLDNKERFRQMVMEEKARQEQKLVPAGHQIVNLRISAHFGEAHWAAEQMSGISYLFFLRELLRSIDEDWSGVVAALREIQHILVNRNAMILNVTLDNRNRSSFETHLKRLLPSLPGFPVAQALWHNEEPASVEGMTIPSQVNYVGKGADLYKLGYLFHGSALVITRYVRNALLWDRVRVQGGAYGAFCLFDRLSGVLSFVSYRDPNIIKTLMAFDQTARFLRDIRLDEGELIKSIIGTIGDIDAYLLPDAKGYISMLRHLTNDTDESRQQVRDEVLTTTAADFRTFAGELEKMQDSQVMKILGSPSAIKAAEADLPAGHQVLKVL